MKQGAITVRKRTVNPLFVTQQARLPIINSWAEYSSVEEAARPGICLRRIAVV